MVDLLARIEAYKRVEIADAVLVEVHDKRELDDAPELGVRIIAVNNRDLRIFAADLAASERLVRIPSVRIPVGESGICTSADCARLACVGVRTELSVESLMRQAKVAAVACTLLAPAGAALRAAP